jgi:hypothetical protein
MINHIKKAVLAIVLIVLLAHCKQEKEPVLKEPWIDRPIATWPSFALINEINFSDMKFQHLGNSFLLDTGKDTVAVTCKHVFLAFEKNVGLNTIELGQDFISWKSYPLNNPTIEVVMDSLVNKNPSEKVVPFREMKIKDWLIFDYNKKDSSIYPLKLRTKPVLKHEVVYAIGWGSEQKSMDFPEKTILQCYDNMGPYFYVRTLSKNISPNSKSGSPVIDKNGYLVGIVSGAEGKLGVIGSVEYLLDMLDQYSIPYESN